MIGGGVFWRLCLTALFAIPMGNNGAESGNRRDMALALLDKETLLCKPEFISIGLIDRIDTVIMIRALIMYSAGSAGTDLRETYNTCGPNQRHFRFTMI